MNFLKLHQDGKPILINLDNVTDIHSRGSAGECSIYFNTLYATEQARIDVDETLEQIQDLIKYGKSEL